jgi:pyocin large subunit-like protein
VPFATAYQRDSHFKRHGGEFGAATEAEYEAMADRFMLGPMNANTRDCTRSNGDDYLRMDLIRTDFGVTCVTSGFLRTFYRPTTIKIWNRGGTARFLAYECAKVI